MNPAAADTLDWHRIVRPGDQVVCSHMTAEPVALLRALAASRAHDGRFEVFLGVPFSDAAGGFAPATTFTTFGAMGSAGTLVRSHATRISAAHYSQCGDAFASGASAADVVLVSLARDAAGRLCLGASHGYVLDAARRARVVVAEINALAPAVAGAPWPDEIAIGHRIETVVSARGRRRAAGERGRAAHRRARRGAGGRRRVPAGRHRQPRLGGRRGPARPPLPRRPQRHADAGAAGAGRARQRRQQPEGDRRRRLGHGLRLRRRGALRGRARATRRCACASRATRTAAR